VEKISSRVLNQNEFAVFREGTGFSDQRKTVARESGGAYSPEPICRGQICRSTAALGNISIALNDTRVLVSAKATVQI